MQPHSIPENSRDHKAWRTCWLKDGFVTIRLPDGLFGHINFDILMPASTHRGDHGFIKRDDGKSFSVFFTNETRFDCRDFKEPTAIIPNYDPLQAWWVFPPNAEQSTPSNVLNLKGTSDLG